MASSHCVDVGGDDTAAVLAILDKTAREASDLVARPDDYLVALPGFRDRIQGLRSTVLQRTNRVLVTRLLVMLNALGGIAGQHKTGREAEAERELAAETPASSEVTTLPPYPRVPEGGGFVSRDAAVRAEPQAAGVAGIVPSAGVGRPPRASGSILSRGPRSLMSVDGGDLDDDESSMTSLGPGRGAALSVPLGWPASDNFSSQEDTRAEGPSHLGPKNRVPRGGASFAASRPCVGPESKLVDPRACGPSSTPPDSDADGSDDGGILLGSQGGLSLSNGSGGTQTATGTGMSDWRSSVRRSHLGAVLHDVRSRGTAPGTTRLARKSAHPSIGLGVPSSLQDGSGKSQSSSAATPRRPARSQWEHPIRAATTSSEEELEPEAPAVRTLPQGGGPMRSASASSGAQPASSSSPSSPAVAGPTLLPARPDEGGDSAVVAPGGVAGGPSVFGGAPGVVPQPVPIALRVEDVHLQPSAVRAGAERSRRPRVDPARWDSDRTLEVSRLHSVAPIRAAHLVEGDVMARASGGRGSALRARIDSEPLRGSEAVSGEDRRHGPRQASGGTGREHLSSIRNRAMVRKTRPGGRGEVAVCRICEHPLPVVLFAEHLRVCSLLRGPDASPPASSAGGDESHHDVDVRVAELDRLLMRAARAAGDRERKAMRDALRIPSSWGPWGDVVADAEGAAPPDETSRGGSQPTTGGLRHLAATGIGEDLAGAMMSAQSTRPDGPDHKLATETETAIGMPEQRRDDTPAGDDVEDPETTARRDASRPLRYLGRVAALAAALYKIRPPTETDLRQRAVRAAAKPGPNGMPLPPRQAADAAREAQAVALAAPVKRAKRIVVHARRVHRALERVLREPASSFPLDVSGPARSTEPAWHAAATSAAVWARKVCWLARAKGMALSAATRNLERELSSARWQSEAGSDALVASAGPADEDAGDAEDELPPLLPTTPMAGLAAGGEIEPPSPAPAVRGELSIDDFRFLKYISRGAYGRVYLMAKKATGDVFAIKAMSKRDLLRKNLVSSIRAERDIMAATNHPFLVRFFHSFQSRDTVYLVMEYSPGGDLFGLLRKMERLPEDAAATYVAETIAAIRYCHSSGVIHRDIKPDNLLIGADGHLKLTDFGLSTTAAAGAALMASGGDGSGRSGEIKATDGAAALSQDGCVGVGPVTSGEGTALALPAGNVGAISGCMGMARTREVGTVQLGGMGSVGSAGGAEAEQDGGRKMGTPDYMAPEVLLGDGHTWASDWWSVGVMAYELIAGFCPFSADSPEEIFDNILMGELPEWPNDPDDGMPLFSPEAQDFILSLLDGDPKTRLGGSRGAQELMEHPWLRKIDWDLLELGKSEPVFVPELEGIDDTSFFWQEGKKDVSRDSMAADFGLGERQRNKDRSKSRIRSQPLARGQPTPMSRFARSATAPRDAEVETAGLTGDPDGDDPDIDTPRSAEDGTGHESQGQADASPARSHIPIASVHEDPDRELAATQVSAVSKPKPKKQVSFRVAEDMPLLLEATPSVQSRARSGGSSLNSPGSRTAVSGSELPAVGQSHGPQPADNDTPLHTERVSRVSSHACVPLGSASSHGNGSVRGQDASGNLETTLVANDEDAEPPGMSWERSSQLAGAQCDVQQGARSLSAEAQDREVDETDLLATGEVDMAQADPAGLFRMRMASQRQDGEVGRRHKSSRQIDVTADVLAEYRKRMSTLVGPGGSRRGSRRGLDSALPGETASHNVPGDSASVSRGASQLGGVRIGSRPASPAGSRMGDSSGYDCRLPCSMPGTPRRSADGGEIRYCPFAGSAQCSSSEGGEHHQRLSESGGSDMRAAGRSASARSRFGAGDQRSGQGDRRSTDSGAAGPFNLIAPGGMVPASCQSSTAQQSDGTRVPVASDSERFRGSSNSFCTRGSALDDVVDNLRFAPDSLPTSRAPEAVVANRSVVADGSAALLERTPMKRIAFAFQEEAADAPRRVQFLDGPSQPSGVLFGEGSAHSSASVKSGVLVELIGDDGGALKRGSGTRRLARTTRRSEASGASFGKMHAGTGTGASGDGESSKGIWGVKEEEGRGVRSQSLRISGRAGAVLGVIATDDAARSACRAESKSALEPGPVPVVGTRKLALSGCPRVPNAAVEGDGRPDILSPGEADAALPGGPESLGSSSASSSEAAALAAAFEGFDFSHTTNATR